MQKSYKPSSADLKKAYNLYKKGYTNKDIAKELGISYSTYQKYKKIFAKHFKQSENEEAVKMSGTVSQGGTNKGKRKLTIKMRENVLDCLSHDLSVDVAARIVGVAKSTIYEWCKEYPSFKRLMDSAREKSVLSIKKYLFKAAKGGYVTELRVKELYNKMGELIGTEHNTHRKYISPSVAAQQFILVNKEKWSHDSQGGGSNQKGKILEALEKMSEISEEEMEKFDEANKNQKC